MWLSSKEEQERAAKILRAVADAVESGEATEFRLEVNKETDFRLKGVIRFGDGQGLITFFERAM